MNETPYFDAWVYGRLSGDVALQAAAPGGVFEGLIPQGVTKPAVRFHTQAATDTLGNAGNRVIVQALYLVAVVARATSYGPLASAADAIDSALHRRTGQQGPVFVLQCWREEPFKLLEPLDDVQYRHLGGLYRVIGHES